jgi:predicted Zn-ribbon and HTH transcriptional regulator
MPNHTPKACPKCGTTIYYDGLCYRCSLKERFARFQNMTADEENVLIAKMAAGIRALKDGSWKEVSRALGDLPMLIAAREIDSLPLSEAAREKEIILGGDESTIFRRSSQETRDWLIRLLLEDGCDDANNIMQCLAMIGDDEVLRTFYELEHHPRAWRKDLHVNPSVYAECAGWSFDNEGKRVELKFPECYALEEGNPQEDKAVLVSQIREDSCPHCALPMMDALVIDGGDERLKFLGLNGKVRVPICYNCAPMAEQTVVRYTLDGGSTAHFDGEAGSKAYLKPEMLKSLSRNKLTLAKERATPFRAYAESAVIGGVAYWIQDWDYRPCPGCGKKMKLLACLPWDELMGEISEGALYVEICAECQVIVAFHQQT